MLFYNNPEAAAAVMAGRREDMGQSLASVHVETGEDVPKGLTPRRIVRPVAVMSR